MFVGECTEKERLLNSCTGLNNVIFISGQPKEKIPAYFSVCDIGLADLKDHEVFKKVIGWIRTFIKENPHAALAALGVLVASIVVPAVLGLVAAVAALFSPVLLVIGVIAALAAGLVYAYKHVGIFHAFVNAVAEFFVKDFVPIVK